MVELTRARLMSHLPLAAGAGLGAIVAIAAVVLPTALLEGFVETSGIAALVPVAAPPLGTTARAVLALGGGGVLCVVTWAALYLLVGPGGPLAPRATTADATRSDAVPTVRRADAHPDAPPRWPLSATELPATLPPIEQPMPADLDTPLAAFDPDALPPTPMPPARPVRALAPSPAPALAPGERLETFTLTPPPPPAPAPAVRRDEPPSIEALLRRLEQGARRKVAAAH